VSRVLHVSAYYAPAYRYGGPPRSIHGLCRALCRHGVDVQVLTTDADGPGRLPEQVTSAAAFEGVPVRYFPRDWPLNPIGSRTMVASLPAALASADVVHIHGLWNRAVWGAARAAYRAGVPYVVSARGMLQDAALAHRPWRKKAAFALVERRLLERAALLHATSEEEVATLERLGTGRPVVLIPNGIEPRHPAGPAHVSADRPFAQEDARGDHRQVADAPTVLFVGRLHPIKRLDLLVDAYTLLTQQYPGARLVIAGPDEAGLRPSLDARAGEHAAGIQWCGAVDAAARDRLLGDATALVCCSDSESFGMSVLEALAVGTPVVVTDTCGWMDVERHQLGFRVPQTAPAIAQALARLVAAPEAAREMGARGRALAESRYTWPAVARAFAEQYDRLHRSRTGAASSMQRTA
jgi:glycosyltransferase involved in cell wall biosynthesis